MFMKLRKKLSKSRKGFTLVELIIVMAILGILASIAIPTFAGVQARAGVKANIATANSIIHEARVLQQENGTETAVTTTPIATAHTNPTFAVSGGGSGKYVVTWTETNQTAVTAVQPTVTGMTNTLLVCKLTEQ